MPATILVVDDEPVMLLLCSTVLQSAGYTTHTATGGWEAWTQAQQHQQRRFCSRSGA
jgi:CheY-like chemotaxis protein